MMQGDIFLGPADADHEVKRSARFSDCGHYRWELRRWWRRNPTWLVVFGLNPSTADGQVDDATMRRVMSFARAAGYGGVIMLNLYCYRATDPAELKAVPDPVGLDMDAYLELCLEALGRFNDEEAVPLAAWGSHPLAIERAAQIAPIISADWYCLGTTKDGHPRHPLYVKGTQRLELWEMPS